MIQSPPAPVRPSTALRVRPPAPPAVVEQLVRRLGVPPLLASMLWNRGFRDDAAELLRPSLVPSAIAELLPAAARLEEAVSRKERILIHGDYDADGISGTAILLLGLRALGANVSAFIPDRLSDGYGVHPERVEEHIARSDLFLTVDCGIGNVAEVARLRAAGVDVIVTDHHHPGQSLPDCLVVHPSLAPNSGSGEAELTGAGVAYHLLWALHRRLGMEAPLEYSDIATIGTIADVAPLLGENRALVLAGLERLEHSSWPGLRASVAQASLRNGITARDVAFILAPRLNAAGRLGEADKGLELLTTASERRARELAAYLDARNQDRRKIQDEMFAEALPQVEHDAPALVIASDDWHPGVMGIVASKLLERFFKPVFIIAKGKGSVRSTPGISAVAALDSASEHLLRYGGHPQAAGFSIAAEQIGPFRDAICRFVATHPTPEPTLTADVAVTAAEVDAELLRAMNELEPFGQGNPTPILAMTDRLEVARAVGRESATLQLRIAGVRGVAWQKGELASSLRTGELVTAAITIREREWKGKRELEFVAEEIGPLEPLALAEFNPGPRPDALVRRGTPPPGTPRLETERPASGPSAFCVKRFPNPADPLSTTAGLRALLRAGTTLYLDLDEAALAEARLAAQRLPTVGDIRRGFVCLQRAATMPFEPAKQELVRTILVELDLLDSLGRVRRGEKRDPHTSATLMTALIEKYRLGSLINAYCTFDDTSFSTAALTLLSD